MSKIKDDILKIDNSKFGTNKDKFDLFNELIVSKINEYAINDSFDVDSDNNDKIMTM